MDFEIIKEVNKVIKSKIFSSLNEQEREEQVLNSIKRLVAKFLFLFDIKMDNEEKLSVMVLELNRNLDYITKQKFNLELTHALINGLIASLGHNIELIETDIKSLGINPLYTYDLNMSLISIKTYSEMDLGNLSVSLIKTIEANLKDNVAYKLK